MGIVDDLIDLFPDTLAVQPGYRTITGLFVASGSALASIPCYISGESRTVRDSTGKEVLSTVHVICAGDFALTTRFHLYTLPSRFKPNANLEAVSVEHASDEDGPHHQTVYFR